MAGIKTFKIDSSSSRPSKRERLEFSPGKAVVLSKGDDIDNKLARDVFWPMAEKHGLLDEPINLCDQMQVDDLINTGRYNDALTVALESGHDDMV